MHSMGHLTVAAAAKAAHLGDKCKVVVLTDTMKIGLKGTSKPRERHENEWLTPRKDVITALKKAKVELHNWQEDTVPSNLIDKLLVLDKRQILTSPYEELEALRFEAAEVYSKSLEKRFLAAYLAFKHDTLAKEIRDEIEKRGRNQHDVVDWNMGNWNVAVAYTSGDLTLRPDVKKKIAETWGGRVATVESARRILEDQYKLRVKKPTPPPPPEAPPEDAPPGVQPTAPA